MKLVKARVKDIQKIKKDIYLVSFNSPYLAKQALPGQFLHLKIDQSLLLRRPFSIHKIKNNTIYIIFRVRGKGTELFSQYKKDTKLDILGPLGNGFDLHEQHKTKAEVIMLAGGMGVAPLVFLAETFNKLKEPRAISRKALVLLGAKTTKDILCEADFRRLGLEVRVATDNGSRGFKGTVTGLLKETLSSQNYKSIKNIYACGPKEMFIQLNRVIQRKTKINCQASFEQFMGCGVGICYGCVINTIEGYKRVCRDGPVFDLKEIRL